MYQFKKSRAPYKRYILKAVVLDKAGKGYNYFLNYKLPSGEKTKTWVGVEHIMSFTADVEKKQEKKNTLLLNKRKISIERGKLTEKNTIFSRLMISFWKNLFSQTALGYNMTRPLMEIVNDAFAHQLSEHAIYTDSI